MALASCAEALEPSAPSDKAQVVRASYAPNNSLLFDDVPADQFFAPGRLSLRGRVAWDRELDDLIKDLSMARVYVNGFQQMPALLDPPAVEKPRERTFRASILLSKAEKNELRKELAGLADDYRKAIRTKALELRRSGR